ncbi:hypothetical protein B0H15DRAFT_735277, partial [Mycena belliarum]
RCAEDTDIEEHIRVMRTYQQELATLQKPLPDEDFSYALLTSLPESWNNFISAISEDIIKDPAKLISRILSELQRLREQAGVSTALPAVDKSTAKCYTCGRVGHFASDHGKQNEHSKEEKGKRESDGKDRRGKGNQWKKGRGKGYRANVAQDSDSDDEDFMF